MTSNNVKMTGYQYITNTAPTTFQSAGSIAARATVTYKIPLAVLFGAAGLLPWQSQQLWAHHSGILKGTQGIYHWGGGGHHFEWLTPQA